MRTSLAAVATCILSSTALAQSINEIRVQQTGVDLQVYAEIAGTPGASLNGLTYVVVGNDDFQLPPQQNGSIEAAISLDGQVIPSSGFFVLAESSYSLTVPDMVAALGFAADNNKTHLIVSGFTGLVGDDIDLDDNGVADNAPWESVVSGVALLATTTVDGLVGDYVYATTTVGPDGGAFPSHVKKCPDNANWSIGFADTTGGSDTPGVANPACGSGSGSVLINEIRIDQVGSDNDEYIELSGTPGADLSDLTYLVLGDGTTTTKSGVVECLIPLTGQVMPANGIFLITLKNTGGQDGVAFGQAGNLQTDKLLFENSDHVTHMLVRGFSGQATTGQDLDADDNGVLNLTPWTSVADSVAFVKVASTGPIQDGTTGEWTYQVANESGALTPMVGPDTTFVPGHIYRCSPQGAWKLGFFDPVSAGSNNKDTPKASNPECSTCGEPGSGSCFVAHPTPGCDKGGCCSIVCAFSASCCESLWDTNCASLALAQCLVAGDAPAVQLSEIRLKDPDNTVNNVEYNEYVELTGAPGTSLNGVWVVVTNQVGTAPAQQAASVRAAVELTGLSIGSSGRFLITEQYFNLAGVTTDFNSGGGLVLDNTGTVNVFLMWNFYGAKGDNLDADDDGTFESTPWISIMDSVSVKGDAGRAYSETTVGPSSGQLPGQVYRCVPEGTWTIGPNSIVAGYDTPKAENASCSLPRIFVCGDADAGDCFQPHSNGHCLNRACCEAVCAVVPDCCDVVWDTLCTDAAGTLTACGGGSSAVVINEARVDQTGSDLDEYVELKGAAGTSLDGLALLVIGDGTVTANGTTTDLKSGVVETVIPLSGTMPETGLYLITLFGTAGTTPPNGIIFEGYDATSGLTPVEGDLKTDQLNLENGDNLTFLLVQGFTGAKNDDLDADDNGVLDSTPWTAVLDGVSIVSSIRTAPSTSQEWWYAPRIRPGANGLAQQFYRCDTVGYWLVGNAFFLDPATRTDTPKAINTACPDFGGGGGNNCPGDLDGSLSVDAGDIGSLLVLFGECPGATPGCDGDLDGSGAVDAGDIGSLLVLFGPCPE